MKAYIITIIIILALGLMIKDQNRTLTDRQKELINAVTHAVSLCLFLWGWIIVLVQ